MNGGINVLLHDLLRDHDRVFKIVTIPGHEGHQHIAAEGKFAVVGVRTVGDDLPFLDVLAFVHNRFLVHASAGVRTHELAQLIHVDAGLWIILQLLAPFGGLTVLGHDNLIGGNGGNFAAVDRERNGV